MIGGEKMNMLYWIVVGFSLLFMVGIAFVLIEDCLCGRKRLNWEDEYIKEMRKLFKG